MSLKTPNSSRQKVLNLSWKVDECQALVGDDLLVTNPGRVATAIEVGRCSFTLGFRS